MKHHETDHDEAIDRVFAGLRKAEPLEGMQQRVLRRARERAGARRRSTLCLPSASTHFWAVAAIMVVAIALAASWTITRSRRDVHETAHAPAYASPTNGPGAQTNFATAHVTATQPAHERRSVSAERPALPIEPVSDEDALAISEMLAPSKPAPPLPLTHQERLLTEVVHHGAPEELARLRPDVRDREIEIAKAEFHDFFDPPSSDRPPAKANE